MAIYLKKFETQSAYEAAQSGLILPNVSFTVDNNTVHYNPSTPPTPSHDFVEIGGLKWATMNIGANSVTDTGLYFQWADTQGYTASQVGSGEGQKYFGWDDYKYNPNGDGSTMTKYNSTDGKTVLDAEDDAVTAAWGGGWRMPTASEFIALGNATTSAWTVDYEGSGVAGVVLTSNADSSKKLFFPACGRAMFGSVEYVGNGFYWSSSLNNDSDDTLAYDLELDSDSACGYSSYDRSSGNLVRGILDE